jgi:hypothetical protein
MAAAGLQAGCNYQFAGSFVIGIQGDYDWVDAGFSREVTGRMQDTYHRARLLRARCYWPSGRAADQGDELAPPHGEHGDLLPPACPRHR